ncbi:DUF4145 domain-containing protein [Blastococcus sp. SYSU DS0616]
MPRRVCWFCEAYSNMSWVDGRGARLDSGLIDYVGVYSCDSCHHLSLGTVTRNSQELGMRGSVQNVLSTFDSSIRWQPVKATGKDYPDVPEAIREAASEVHQCLSIGAIRGAIAIARAVVEATAKDQGITTGTLQQKIDGLANAGKIRPDTQDAAHEVRLDGNEIAHGDLAATPPDVAEAEEIVALMDEVLEEVYEGPARVARARANRAARKQAPRSATLP